MSSGSRSRDDRSRSTGSDTTSSLAAGSSRGIRDESPSEVGRAETLTPELADAPSAALSPAERFTQADTADQSATAELGGRPEADRLARAVARTKIANQLFAQTEQVRLGRYHLLEMVGSGGMGVVWGAWDPELERRVAIKLVKATMQSARDRIQLEGQALAKLSHPNVVTVYDVGVVDDQVYIVMEWVRGQNLRDYCRKPRTLHDILALYRAAGEGLAAAHAEGLIHRDFKPDNAIRGDDGRVRVLDFGLARNDVRAADDGTTPVSSDMTRGAGTPRYMPPEQAEGGTLSPAVDQYAFCVSLREAITNRSADGKKADVPKWIDAVLVRGTAREAKDRFPAMTELLRALGRDPARLWRNRLVVGGAVAATATAFAVGNLQGASAPTVEPCSGSQQEIAQTWSPDARAQMTAHLQTLGAYGRDEAPRLDGELTKYAAQWAASHRAACIANQRRELTAQLYERNLGCLGRARVGFATVVDLLAHVPHERLSNAIVATRSLPDTGRCLGETLASTVEPPRPEIAAQANKLADELVRLRVLAQAADPGAQAAVAVAVKESEALGYLPLLARAQLLQGFNLMVRGDGARAAPLFDQASKSAIDANDEVLFVEAYAREIFAISTTDKQQLAEHAVDALGAIPYVERIARRLGAAASFERPLLFNNIGVSRRAASDKAGAKAWFTKAMDEPRTREGEIELVSAVGNLALSADSSAERDPLFVKEGDTLTQLLGANHVRTLEAKFKSAMFIENPATAAAKIGDACKRVSTYHAKEAVELLSRCAYDVGWLAEERNSGEQARASMQLVSDHRKPIAEAYLAALEGKLEQAARQSRTAAEGLQNEWWNKFYAGDGFLFAALCEHRLGRRNGAVKDARAALALYDQLTVIKEAPFYLRRVMRTKGLLARLLASTAPAEATKLAADAASWYRAAGGYDAVAAELEAIAITAR